MKALQCEFCGGKLIAKAGDTFECVSCGMLYEKSRVQEMIQQVTGTVKVEGVATVDSLIKRGYLLLEECAWSGAEELFDRALDIDPENASAYVGFVLCGAALSNVDDLKQYDGDLLSDPNWQMAKRFAKGILSTDLKAIEHKWQLYQPIAEQKRQETERKRQEEHKRKLKEEQKKREEEQKLQEENRRLAEEEKRQKQAEEARIRDEKWKEDAQKQRQHEEMLIEKLKLYRRKESWRIAVVSVGFLIPMVIFWLIQGKQNDYNLVDFIVPIVFLLLSWVLLFFSNNRFVHEHVVAGWIALFLEIAFLSSSIMTVVEAFLGFGDR
ncbi:MAG: hypothetical protein Q4F69_12175, partial [Bacteroidia bacterium]|nr:hypothetical protein [Bacteroidia bacterium]